MSQNQLSPQLRIDLDLDDCLVDTSYMIAKHFSVKYGEPLIIPKNPCWESFLPNVSKEKIDDIVWNYDKHEIFNPRKVIWNEGALLFMQALLGFQKATATVGVNVRVFINTANPMKSYVTDLVEITNQLQNVVEDVIFCERKWEGSSSHILLDNDVRNVREWNTVTSEDLLPISRAQIPENRYGIHYLNSWDMKTKFQGNQDSAKNFYEALQLIKSYYDRNYKQHGVGKKTRKLH